MNITRAVLFFTLLFTLQSSVFSQAKKPRIMVVPSDNWCEQHGYMESFDDQGTIERIPNYKRALQGNTELLLVISKLNSLMADRGFPLVDLESTLRSLQSESAEDALLTSKSGAGIAESPIDRLRKTANADIIMQLSWKVNTTGPKKSITYILRGLDAYTNKQVAGAEGTGAPSFSTEVPVLLEEAVLTHIDNFNARLQDHFDDMFENGREVIVRIKKFDSWDGDLESEYNGEELGMVLEDWMSDNTVKGRFSTDIATENQMLFTQVRIPLYDERERATDARRYFRSLQTFLQNSPYNIVNKLMTKGLGEVTIVLGEK